jgi:hypothetical protein
MPGFTRCPYRGFPSPTTSIRPACCVQKATRSLRARKTASGRRNVPSRAWGCDGSRKSKHFPRAFPLGKGAGMSRSASLFQVAGLRDPFRSAGPTPEARGLGEMPRGHSSLASTVNSPPLRERPHGFREFSPRCRGSSNPTSLLRRGPEAGRRRRLEHWWIEEDDAGKETPGPSRDRQGAILPRSLAMADPIDLIGFAGVGPLRK